MKINNSVTDSPDDVKLKLKSDLVSYLQHSEGLSGNKAKAVIKRIIQWILINLSQGNKVSLKGFGSFYSTYVAGRITKHPVSKDPVEISERARLVFKPEKNAKRVIQHCLDIIRPDKDD